MTTIVERLRIWPAADGADGLASHFVEALMREAADQIEEWKQAAGVEAGLRREFLARAEKAEAAIARTLEYVGDLDRHGSIDHGAAFEIMQRLAAR